MVIKFNKMLFILILIAISSTGFIKTDKICSVFKKGLIDTAFENKGVFIQSTYYILKGEYLVEIAGPDLRVLLPRLRNISSLWNTSDQNPLKDVEIAFSVYAIWDKSVYFIRNSTYYHYEFLARKPIIEPMNKLLLEGVSVAFHPKVWPNTRHFIFINQTRQRDGTIIRENLIYDITYFDEPEELEEPESIPSYLTAIDDRYWIKAILEGDINEGLIFVEYENVGYHCRFNNHSHTCDWNKIRNDYLFGCEALEKHNEQILIPSAIKDANPEDKSVVQFLKYEKIVYCVILGILLTIVFIVFLVLPIYVTFFRGKHSQK